MNIVNTWPKPTPADISRSLTRVHPPRTVSAIAALGRWSTRQRTRLRRAPELGCAGRSVPFDFWDRCGVCLSTAAQVGFVEEDLRGTIGGDGPERWHRILGSGHTTTRLTREGDMEGRGRGVGHRVRGPMVLRTATGGYAYGPCPGSISPAQGPRARQS